jgi:transcriptional regulator with XRE-family HTH domain
MQPAGERAQTVAQLPADPGPVDWRVGARIRCQRELQGLSVETLAARLGSTGPLILDYEAGRTRAVATTLILLARGLDVGVGYFLGGLVDEPVSAAEAVPHGAGGPAP